MLKSPLNHIVQKINTASSFTESLEVMVAQVREAVGTQACTIFLIDKEKEEYVLAATTGLNINSVGAVRLKFNEGIVGLIGERKELINLEDASEHPRFRFFEGVGEERFKAFLGVPIIHDRQVLGVLIVEQAERRRFDPEDETFVLTMAALLAEIIAHAEATGSINKLFESSATKDLKKEIILSGIPGAAGISVGTAILIYPPADLEAVPERKIDDSQSEIKLFEKALEACRLDIKMLAQRLAQTLPEEEQEIFNVYLHILSSSTLIGEVIEQIKAGFWAQTALCRVVKKHVARFEEMEDEYLRERASDIHDLGRRILSHLQVSENKVKHYKPDTILIGEEITATNLAEVPEGCLVGIVSAKGSTNSHVAILARALNIPAVMAVDGIADIYRDGELMILDGYQGQVYINPSPLVLQEFSLSVEEKRKFEKTLEKARNLPAETIDNHRISLFVNTGLAMDANLSLSVGAEGVGLYRTEIPFMNRDRFPSEEDQRLIYRQLLQAFNPRPVTMRTLDVGGDKALPYFPIKEENPFLGWRGIRITLDHPELFLVQIRAMLRASSGLNNLWIMLPMISGVSEVDEALHLIRQAHQEILEEDPKILFPPVGVMVEVPAAVYQVKAIAQRVNFLSVGSNDLIQYLLAVDRNNSRVANLYDSFHPAVLYALKQVVEIAHAENKKVSMCGEMAGDPLAVILLLAMGFDALSMSSSALPAIKWAIRHISLKKAKDILARCFEMDHPKIIREYLAGELERAGLGNLIHAGSK